VVSITRSEILRDRVIRRSTRPEIKIDLKSNSKSIFQLVRTKEGLPETGAQMGQVIMVEETESLHVWDGDEWANLGEVVKETKGILTDMRNRRAEAIAATRKKREARGE